ncbi:hypothetical protein HYT57_03570 [Candidatus Woesearchaeota archaeon]|nr:hypothetical protein [Candidatus Woesearchaeota archaeon]
MRRGLISLLSASLFFYSSSFSQDEIRIGPYQQDIKVNSLDGRHFLFHHRYTTKNLEKLALISDNVDVSSVTRYLLPKSGIEHLGLTSLVFKDEKTVETSDSTYTHYSLELKLLPTLDKAFQDSVIVPVYDFYSITARKEIFVNRHRTFFLIISDGALGRNSVGSAGFRKPVDGFVDRAGLFKDGKWISVEFAGVSRDSAFVKSQRAYIEVVNALIEQK